ncbi:hypothetical protein LAROYE_38 [Arthrobacter phage Laroye]|uniref:Uncharacterized protein n=1 Tax=Arthrobacter phage Laroye TaxID=1772305 RepID=A0A0U4B483_9CAUD|nr:hypothetical protein FDH64_gp38 [Arthrobacter phage Laroye]ALY09565.1 hypothetical protein LAROYE_38 [Arthrobacter phage Laroye]
MPLSNATIESRGNGHGTITLDGADVSHLVGKVEFTSQPGKVDTLVLHTHIAAKIEAKGVKVVLDEQTRNWLAALGWTPPVEGECPTTPHDCGDGEPRRLATWNSRLGRNSCGVNGPCDACLERGEAPRATMSPAEVEAAIADFHDPLKTPYIIPND